MSNERNWMGSAQDWLCKEANKHFSDWSETKAGKRWQRSQNTRRHASPEKFGYFQPEWMFTARELLGKGDEEAFKAFKLAILGGCFQ